MASEIFTGDALLVRNLNRRWTLQIPYGFDEDLRVRQARESLFNNAELRPPLTQSLEIALKESTI